MKLEKAVFTGYRGSLRSQRNKQILVKIDRIDTRDKAAKYIGSKVVWKNQQGKTLIGKITGVHGRNVVLKRARYLKDVEDKTLDIKFLQQIREYKLGTKPIFVMCFS